jgi:hypothetical protein
MPGHHGASSLRREHFHRRLLQEQAAVGALREKAANILRSWAAAFPGTVEPKY